jgi:hypothetical protein
MKLVCKIKGRTRAKIEQVEAVGFYLFNFCSDAAFNFAHQFHGTPPRLVRTCKMFLNRLSLKHSCWPPRD